MSELDDEPVGNTFCGMIDGASVDAVHLGGQQWKVWLNGQPLTTVFLRFPTADEIRSAAVTPPPLKSADPPTYKHPHP